MSLKPTVALSQDFLKSLSTLPAAAQSKVLKWALRFQHDPTANGINYEKINRARDPNMRSIRLDKDWRGIVFKPLDGDVYVLLYVDHHDAAYRWAESRRLTINPVTGAMQLVLTEEISDRAIETSPPVAFASRQSALPDLSEARPVTEIKPLYGSLSDRDLVSLGTPEELVHRVRAIRSEADLDALQIVLPIEAYEGLFLVAAGDTVSQVLSARATRVDVDVDVKDFAKSLEVAESQSRFVVVENDQDLADILNAPLAQWRVFLHPTQRKLVVTDFSGPVRVLGGAGTGKTVLAMHRAKWLAENRTKEGQKVLFTTFTRNLAFDIEENLKTLCPAATLQKIEVRNLDAWVYKFLRSQRYEHRIVYNRNEEAASAWQSALAIKDTSLGLADSFYEEELDQIILAQGITSGDEYRVARRAGRVAVLSRSKRDLIWPVFEEYRTQLASRKLKEVDDAYRDAATLLSKNEELGSYSSIVVDETQDFGPQALRLLRSMAAPGSNDLFLVGDGHQRIYSRNKAALSRCGIDIRGRGRKLYINYRTTDEIRRQALALLEGCEIDDLDEHLDENKRYKSLSHGPPPITAEFGSLEALLGDLVEMVSRWTQADRREAPLTTCVIASSKVVRDQARKTLDKAGFQTATIEANQSGTTSPDKIYFSTMHRAKGLEFDRVAVLVQQQMLGAIDESADRRRLVYVALTRAKREAGMLIW